jgi:NADH-quinone oxidoreductase subunit N
LTGSTDLAKIQVSIVQSGPSPLFFVASILIVAGLGFKIAAVPFHLWAPDTYEGAPAPAAAFIASVSKVASFALLLTIFQTWMMYQGPFGTLKGIDQILIRSGHTWLPLGTIALIMAAGSMVVGNLAALAPVSVRRLLAYSAIAHAGYILLGVAVYPRYTGHEASYLATLIPVIVSGKAVLYYILTYGLTTIGAFGVVGVVERATGSDRMDAFLGLHKRNPALAAVLLVLFLSLAGIPPLVGFWAKFNLFAVVLGVGAGRIPFALVALAVAMSAVSLYYYLQVLKRVFVMPAVDEPADSTKKISIHPVTMLVLLAIAAAVVGMGCFPALLQGWIEGFYRKL